MVRLSVVLIIAAITCFGSGLSESVQTALESNDTAQIFAKVHPIEAPPTEPKRPIAQTAIGIGLAAEAVLMCVFGAYFLEMADDLGEDSWGLDRFSRFFGVVAMGVGVGSGITGIVLVSISAEKWEVYNAWRKKHPQISIKCQVPF